MSEEQPCPMLWHSSIPMSCRQTQQSLLRLSMQISNSGLQLVGKQWKSAKIENFTNQPVTGRAGGDLQKRFWSAPCRIAWFLMHFHCCWGKWESAKQGIHLWKVWQGVNVGASSVWQCGISVWSVSAHVSHCYMGLSAWSWWSWGQWRLLMQWNLSAFCLFHSSSSTRPTTSSQPY